MTPKGVRKAAAQCPEGERERSPVQKPREAGGGGDRGVKDRERQVTSDLSCLKNLHQFSTNLHT